MPELAPAGYDLWVVEADQGGALVCVHQERRELGEEGLALLSYVISQSQREDWTGWLFRRPEDLRTLARALVGEEVLLAFARGARVCARAFGASAFLSLQELLMYGNMPGEDLSTPDRLREALLVALGLTLRGGQARQLLAWEQEEPVGTLTSEGGFGLPSAPAELGLVIQHGLDAREVREPLAWRRRVEAHDEEMASFGGAIDQLRAQAIEQGVALATRWGWSGDPWAEDVLQALARRDVIVVAHHLSPLRARAPGPASWSWPPIDATPTRYYLSTPARDRPDARVSFDDLWSRLRRGSTSPLQLDLRICHSRAVLDRLEGRGPSAMIHLSGRTTYASFRSIYGSLVELLTSAGARQLLDDLEFRYLDQQTPLLVATSRSMLTTQVRTMLPILHALPRRVR